MRHKGERTPFERADAVLVLRDVMARFSAVPNLTPGDLVQTVDFQASWAGSERAEVTPCLVLALCDDLSTKTDDQKDKDIPGVRIATADPNGVAIQWYERWYFEPYTGPRPDAH